MPNSVPRLSTAILVLCLVTVAPTSASAEAIPVEVKRTGESWQLLRGGTPYYVKGAGGDGAKKLLVECGGNLVFFQQLKSF